MRHRLLLAVLLAGLPTAHAQTCNTTIKATTPTSRYQLNTNGTALDKQTGLVWKRCAEGQTWQAGGCSGVVSLSYWQTALTTAENATFAGKSDWRLPNIKELQSLVEERCYYPAINTSVFYNASNMFWSSSPFNDWVNYALCVDFEKGRVCASEYDYGDKLAVRLVRGGQ